MIRALFEDMMELACLAAFLTGVALMATPAAAAWFG